MNENTLGVGRPDCGVLVNRLVSCCSAHDCLLLLPIYTEHNKGVLTFIQNLKEYFGPIWRK
jgi:hypothetical protein